MNVISTSLAASLVKTLTPVTDPSAKTDEAKSSAKDATSSSGSSKESSTPGQDVAKKLKDMSKALIALTLIQDPIERAKAAARLYKQYAQVAKDYADATGGGRDAAAQADAANAAQNPAQAAGQPVDSETAQAAQTAPDGTPIAPPEAAPVPQPVSPDAAGQVAGQPAATPMIMSGAKPRFVADLYMEEIKTFAGAAKQMYDAAIQEAKFKKLTDKTKKDAGADDMEDAGKTLTEAAKAVEGPDATAEVQMPSGASSPGGSGSFVNLSA
jgi:hypothetical protein